MLVDLVYFVLLLNVPEVLFMFLFEVLNLSDECDVVLDQLISVGLQLCHLLLQLVHQEVCVV